MITDTDCTPRVTYPERRSGLRLNRSEHCFSLVDQIGAQKMKLNQSAALIWELCDGERSVSEITMSLSNIYEVPLAKMLDDVVATLGAFDASDAMRYRLRQYVWRSSSESSRIQYLRISDGMLGLLEQFRALVFDGLRVERVTASDIDLGRAGLERAKANSVSQSTQPKSGVLKFNHLYDHPKYSVLLARIEAGVREIVTDIETTLTVSLCAAYQPGGRMGWHTNDDNPGRRVYCTWAETDRSNFFRYEDPDNNAINTDWESRGWTIKTFYLPPKPDQLWHCIQANSLRLAIGFAEAQFTRVNRLPAVATNVA
ncbi:MAG: PqqD family peptide modification chaperone [Gammaproteobacteria bacterium]|nr:PqqD family peptide modification chaperone [Gammaproteobacteria bacterium]